MNKKGTPRSQQHEWEPSKEDENKVYCTKCKIQVHKNVARRGIGDCKGAPEPVEGEQKAEVHELSPADIRSKIPQSKPFKPSDKDHGKCNGCQGKLKEMPFNSRLGMVACNNPRCPLYRQRLSTFPR